MASVGDVGTEAGELCLGVRYDFEVTTPYYYAVNSSGGTVRAELTATEEAAYYRFTFPASSHAHCHSVWKGAELTILSENSIAGSQHVTAPIARRQQRTKRRGSISMLNSLARSVTFQTWHDESLSRLRNKVGTTLDLSRMRLRTRESRLRFA